MVRSSNTTVWISALVLNLGVACFVVVPPTTKAETRHLVQPTSERSRALPVLSERSTLSTVPESLICQPQEPLVEPAPAITVHVPPMQPPSGDLWLPDRRRCVDASSRGSRAYCDGPRWVARPYGAAAEQAQTLGLGTEAAAAKLLRSRPFPRWVRAVQIPVQGLLLPPVEGARFGRGFGFTRIHHPELEHPGVDFDAAAGSLIRAAQNGLVAYSNNGIHGYGNLVILVHSDGTSTFYAHCQAIYVFPGQQVHRGQLIAEVGSTGLARGPHVHFEFHRDGDPVDPSRRFARSDVH